MQICEASNANIDKYNDFLDTLVKAENLVNYVMEKQYCDDISDIVIDFSNTLQNAFVAFVQNELKPERTVHHD